jgi:hypothetical protein
VVAMKLAWPYCLHEHDFVNMGLSIITKIYEKGVLDN